MEDTSSKAHSTTHMSSSEHEGSNHDEKGAISPDAEKGLSDAGDEAKDPPPPRSAHGFVWLLICASIYMANFLFATDNTIAANIQPAVVRAFGSLDKLAWLPVAFFASSWGTCFLWYVLC